ncbi:MAG: ABC transporter permease subunit [Clostridia bacterium]|nr:ABC transporter permease subunit [Clostridia bacterium]
MKALKTFAKNLIVLAFWLFVWQGLTVLVGNPLLLPSPIAVIGRMAELMLTGSFWHTVALSLGRILLGVVCAVVLGLALAVATSFSRLLHSLFSPLITVIKSTPVASFIILVLIWVGRDILPSVIVVLMALPVVWSNVSTGISSTDALLLQMGRVFRFSFGKTLRRIYIPSVMPHFLSACRSCLGLAWKAGVAAEVLTVPAVSIGKMLYESKLYWETLDLFAWTLVVIICSLISEMVLMAAIGRLGKSRGGNRT